MAVTWIKEFVALAGTEMVPYASGILSAALPCLAYDDDGRKSKLIETDCSFDFNYF
jgi:vacuole morphology and inheritance protein 14